MALSISMYGSMPQVESGAAFEQLFNLEYSRVVAIAYRVLADPIEAEDVAQEAFVSFYRKCSATDPFARSWLHTAAVHIALNMIRGKRRRTNREILDATSSEPLRAGSSSVLDPQLAAVENERHRELRTALSRLPTKSAAALALRYSGLSYAEVAFALHIKVGDVGTVLKRAEAALRKEMTHATPR